MKAALLCSLGSLLLQNAALGQEVITDPNSVRAAAAASGLEPLGNIPVPVPNLVAQGVVVDKLALLRLGKALFWDQKVGSDGQACASCHFDAGADSRAKNQLNPDTRRAIPVPPRDASNPDPENIPDSDVEFGNPGVPGAPGYLQFEVNNTLAATDFPFHVLADPEENNFGLRVVLQDTNDVASSQGAFNADFVRVVPDKPGDIGIPRPDPVFHVNGVNTRRVEPRHTPSNINAVFNFDNFWDGRARNTFNGVSVVGPLDDTATILVNTAGGLTEQPFACTNCSLASQAVGPPLSPEEMAFRKRFFAAVGKKMVNSRGLELQLVHPKDSVLGPLSRATLSGRAVTGTPGLKTTYASLIRAAFAPVYWNSTQTITFAADGNTRIIGGTSKDPFQVFTQMEANFAFFFGLSVQTYQATLVSDDAPFDRFMAGNNDSLSPEQQLGLLIFLNQELRPDGNNIAVDQAIVQVESDNPGVVVGAGNCISCHGGTEFTDASVREVEEEPIEIEEMPVLVDGVLALGTDEALLDNGFSNIGVRPTAEDLARGGKELDQPLSFTRQALSGFEFAPDLPCTTGVDCPNKLQVDGAFKIPGLRNVELTGPYFHTGGQSTLAQVVEFYDRQGDFGDVNIADLDRNMVFIDLDEPDEEPLIDFLLSLTDDRVRKKLAPFDHPQLFVPNGHPGDSNQITCVDPDALQEFGVKQACTNLLKLRAIGAGGRPAAGLPPLGTFLGLSPFE